MLYTARFVRGRAGAGGATTASKRPAPARAIRRGLLPPLLLLASFGIALRTPDACAAETSSLVDLSLEQLANIEVTSVSRKRERLAGAAASAYVITGEDIRRSGATSLPEALRLAPNLQVARVNADSYAISARGFNSTTANKLQVLIDGRIVYTPLYSGVFWDVQDVMLADVERIEVISGPAATLWGGNAVNGVINVITRSAQDSQGGRAEMTGGDGLAVGAVRHGAALDMGGRYRVYGRLARSADTRRADGASASDGSTKGMAGFRADWDRGGEALTLQGDVYDGRISQPAPGTRKVSGFNLNTHWRRRGDDGAIVRWRAYYDRTRRDHPGTFSETLDTLNLDFQQDLAPIGPHAILWGATYRRAWDRVDNSPALAFLPPRRELSWAGVFAQDEITLREGVRLTAGMRLERNDYTGLEHMPSARLAWTTDDRGLIWSALSRAVRTPSRVDRDLYAPGQPPYTLAGGPTFRSEVSNVFEVGYRARPDRIASYSITVFHAAHRHIRSLEPGPGGALVIGNRIEGSTDGLELWGNLQARANWHLSAGLLAARPRLRLAADSGSTSSTAIEGNDPSHQWMLRSVLDLSGGRELDVALRRVAALRSPAVPAYTAVDVRYGWPLGRSVEAAVIAQNLLDASHVEFGAAPGASRIERRVLFRLSATY